MSIGRGDARGQDASHVVGAQRLSDLLTDATFALGAAAPDWRAAVVLAGERLVASGRVEPAYVPEMVKVVEELGPYIVIAPGIALAHARPGPSVHDVAFSFVTLREPVPFGHPQNDPVSLVVGLAAPDNEQHVEALAALARALSAAPTRERLLGARTPREVREILAAVESGEAAMP